MGYGKGLRVALLYLVLSPGTVQYCIQYCTRVYCTVRYSTSTGYSSTTVLCTTTASRCRGGHVRDPINMPRDSGV
jgi:hypothetical protein